jgi:hypothetical protein
VWIIVPIDNPTLCPIGIAIGGKTPGKYQGHWNLITFGCYQCGGTTGNTGSDDQ